jgi:hypothetical protein
MCLATTFLLHCVDWESVVAPMHPCHCSLSHGVDSVVAPLPLWPVARCGQCGGTNATAACRTVWTVWWHQCHCGPSHGVDSVVAPMPLQPVARCGQCGGTNATVARHSARVHTSERGLIDKRRFAVGDTPRSYDTFSLSVLRIWTTVVFNTYWLTAAS